MKLRIGFVILLLSVTAAFSQSKNETPAPTPKVLTDSQKLTLAKLQITFDQVQQQAIATQQQIQSIQAQFNKLQLEYCGAGFVINQAKDDWTCVVKPAEPAKSNVPPPPQPKPAVGKEAPKK